MLRKLMKQTRNYNGGAWQAVAACIPGKPLLAEVYARGGMLFVNDHRTEAELAPLCLFRVGGSFHFDEAAFRRNKQWFVDLGVSEDDPFYKDLLGAFRAAQEGSPAALRYYKMALAQGDLKGWVRAGKQTAVIAPVASSKCI